MVTSNDDVRLASVDSSAHGNASTLSNSLRHCSSAAHLNMRFEFPIGMLHFIGSLVVAVHLEPAPRHNSSFGVDPLGKGGLGHA